MAGEVDAGGVIAWLVYVILALFSAAFAFWNRSITGRVETNEDETARVAAVAESNTRAVHKMEVGIHARFSEHEKEERLRDEGYQRETREELKELRADVNEGHAAILGEVNKLALMVKKNGNDRA